MKEKGILRLTHTHVQRPARVASQHTHAPRCPTRNGDSFQLHTRTSKRSKAWTGTLLLACNSPSSSSSSSASTCPSFLLSFLLLPDAHLPYGQALSHSVFRVLSRFLPFSLDLLLFVLPSLTLLLPRNQNQLVSSSSLLGQDFLLSASLLLCSSLFYFPDASLFFFISRSPSLSFALSPSLVLTHSSFLTLPLKPAFLSHSLSLVLSVSSSSFSLLSLIRNLPCSLSSSLPISFPSSPRLLLSRSLFFSCSSSSTVVPLFSLLPLSLSVLLSYIARVHVTPTPIPSVCSLCFFVFPKASQREPPAVVTAAAGELWSLLLGTLSIGGKKELFHHFIATH